MVRLIFKEVFIVDWLNSSQKKPTITEGLDRKRFREYFFGEWSNKLIWHHSYIF
jgi:hypothetical protein